MKNIILIVLLLFSLDMIGQLVSTDPYTHVGIRNYNNEFKVENIKKQKVSSVDVWSCYVKKGKLKDSTLEFSITFNRQGLPVTYHLEYIEPVWWWPKLKQNLGLARVYTDTVDYKFFYDSKNQLTHFQYKKFDAFSGGGYSLDDVYNTYDSVGSLILQRIEEKRMYPHGYEYRGTPYENDTTVTVIKIKNKRKTVSVISKSDTINKKSKLNQEIIDLNTLMVNMFDKSNNKNILQKDSLNRVYKTVRYSRTYFGIDGSHSNPETEYDIISTYHYSRNGQLDFIEKHYRTGEFIRSIDYEYNNEGLLYKIIEADGRLVTIYKYNKNWL